ncbi:NAD(P)-binding domain-containing protein [Nocardioides taihuensis]|uniref:NAD(P)-binding domain-containing protein n=1 Tax=Nocardioides taihuensis TaxID=1835606 RepID=A0ABW0BQ27_9ACTN
MVLSDSRGPEAPADLVEELGPRARAATAVEAAEAGDVVVVTINFEFLRSLARPSGSPERSVLAIAGDSDEARKTVSDLLDSLGYDAYDVGPLAEGWRFQGGTAAYASLDNDGPADVWPPESPRRVTAEMLREKLARAKSYRDR